jgi:hypothetical protein
VSMESELRPNTLRFLTSAAASTIIPQRRRRRVLESRCLTIGEATQYFFLVVSCLAKLLEGGLPAVHPILERSDRGALVITAVATAKFP